MVGGVFILGDQPICFCCRKSSREGGAQADLQGQADELSKRARGLGSALFGEAEASTIGHGSKSRTTSEHLNPTTKID